MNNLSEKFSEINVNSPSFEWTLLPPELKAHCVKQMNFKTRTGLRCSSKTEMRLVDSVKYSLKHVIITIEPKESNFEVAVFNNREFLNVKFKTDEEEDEEVERTTDLSVEDPRSFQKVVDFLKQILTSKINHLELKIESDGRGDKDQKLITDVINKGPVLNVKKLEIPLNTAKPMGIEALMHCSSEFLTKIVFSELEVVDFDFFEDFVLIPQVISASKLDVFNFDISNDKIIRNKVAFMTALYKQWALDDAPIGKELIVRRFPDVFQNDNFMAHFRKFLARHDETLNAMLLKTCERSKLIWIRVAPADNLLQMFVVDADSEEPDFKKMDEARNPIRDIADQINAGEREDYDEYDDLF